jgi:putative ABC transport system substrate-binding protein
MIGRRHFITLLGGAAAAWPIAARAQQPARVRMIGVLMNLTADDPVSHLRLAAFAQGLQESGWAIGRNVGIEYRFGAGDNELYRKYAAELVGLAPDVIMTVGGTSAGALQQASRSVPIVFVETADPVSRGLVASLARPGGNTTGFTQFEFSLSGKWLELLKQIAPGVTRAAVVRDPTQFSGVGEMAATQTAAVSFGVELTPIDARNADEIERAVTAFASSPSGGLIVVSSARALILRDVIIMLAARYRLPAIYPFRYFVSGGGLMSYGPDDLDPFRRAAGYVDRILKGEKPADLPVQQATKVELVINLKTAKALGITVPTALLARADEVIE